MSKQLIEKKDVAEAIDALKRGGKTVNLNSIRAALGNKGSLSTISELKKEIEEAAAAALYPPQAIAAFQAIWVEAVQKGRGERESEIKDLKDLNDALLGELKTLEGESVAAKATAAEMKEKHEIASTKLNNANEALLVAREEAERNALRLVEQIRVDQEALTKERELFNAQQARAHELEVKLARADKELELLKTKSTGRPKKSAQSQNGVLDRDQNTKLTNS